MAGFSREVARRLFAEELRNSNRSFRDVEDQYAPSYLLTPTGAKCNRVFMVGTLTERDNIGGDTEYWRGRLVDPTGSILVYAGQYQPEAAQKLASIETPSFVAVVGKPNLYQTEDGNVIISLRAEAIQKVDEATRDRWILETAKLTQERLKAMENAVPISMEFSSADKTAATQATDVDQAKQHYNTDVKQYRQMLIRALSSLMMDLDQMPKARFDEQHSDESAISDVDKIGAKEADALVVDAALEDAASKDASSRSKAKPEPKQETTKKSRSKASAPRETHISGFHKSEEQDDVETINVFKKS